MFSFGSEQNNPVCLPIGWKKRSCLPIDSYACGTSNIGNWKQNAYVEKLNLIIVTPCGPLNMNQRASKALPRSLGPLVEEHPLVLLDHTGVDAVDHPVDVALLSGLCGLHGGGIRGRACRHEEWGIAIEN